MSGACKILSPDARLRLRRFGLNALRHPGPPTTRARPFVSTVLGSARYPRRPRTVSSANGAAMLAAVCSPSGASPGSALARPRGHWS